MQINNTDAEVWLATIPMAEYRAGPDEVAASAPASTVTTATAVIATAAAEARPEVQVPEWQLLEFTGTGKEYFRIWIVNLCLSLASLGIYSAWAKVRRLQYFDRNTSLAGAVFNFHGEAKTILRGRIVAVILLFFYHYLFTFSKKLALSLFILFLLGIPLMMRSALRFRLRQTSYRGLRFNFVGSLPDAFATYFPVAFVFLLPGLFGVLYPEEPWMAGLAFAGYLTWPWLHARMRIYQHRHICLGQLQSNCDMTGGAFGWSYAGVCVVAVMLFLLFAICVGLGSTFLKKVGAGYQHPFSTADDWLGLFFMLLGLLIFALSAVGSVSYIQVNAWNKSWDKTSFPGIDIDSSLPFWPYWRLQLKNLLLTLLTLGLYRPFAIVALHKFRLSYVRIRAADFGHVRQAGVDGRSQAAGDSSADMFGFDLSW